MPGTGTRTISTLNHQHCLQIGFMRTIWTTVSHMNGIPFHTRLRTPIFRMSLFCKQPAFPRPLHCLFPPSLCCFLTNIKPALSQLWLWLPRQGEKGGRPHDHSRPNTATEVSRLPGRLRSVLGSCAYGSYFRAPLMNCASAQQSQCVGEEEDCWLSEKTFQAFLCLSDAARRSAFRGTRRRGEGDGNIGLGRCRGTD